VGRFIPPSGRVPLKQSRHRKTRGKGLHKQYELRLRQNLPHNNLVVGEQVEPATERGMEVADDLTATGGANALRLGSHSIKLIGRQVIGGTILVSAGNDLDSVHHQPRIIVQRRGQDAACLYSPIGLPETCIGCGP
jgi:hypothetical protein